MFATGITSNLSIGATHYRTSRKRVTARNQPKEKNSGSIGSRHAFLRQPITPRAPQKVVRSRFEENYNYLTRANYLYLLRCVENYARLLGKEHLHNPGDSVGAGICNLYYELENLIGEGISINIHAVEKRLMFVLWSPYEWGNYNVYWIPLQFVESLPTRLKRLTVSFFHQFKKSMRLDTTNQSEDMELILEWMLDTAEDYDDDGDRRAYLKQIADYREGGSVYKLMERVTTRCFHKNLAAALDRYIPASESERKWIAVMKEGLRFAGENQPSIFQYAYDMYEDEDHENEALKLDQMIRFIYDPFDAVTEQLSQYVDDVYNNGYAVGTCATLRLTPDMREPFGKEAFPEEFFGYMDKLNDFIRENSYA